MFSPAKRSPSRRKSRPFAVENLESRNVMAAIVPGGITAGTISSSTETDLLTFTAAQHDIVDLILRSEGITPGFQAYAELFDPSGDQVTYFRFDNGNQRIGLEESGEYTLKVFDDGLNARGRYWVGHESIHPFSPNPVPLVMGGIVSGGINQLHEKDQFTFSVPDGSLVELIMRSTPTTEGFQAYAELFSEAGERVDYFRYDNGNQRIPLPDGGEYMLMVYDDGHNATGTYQIGLEGIDPISPNPVPLVKGDIVDGAISKLMEKDQFVFNAAKGSMIELIMKSTPSDGGNFKAYAELFAPSGERVTYFRFDNGNQRIQSLPETGRYMLMVYDDGYESLGTYSIGLESLKPLSPSPIPLPAGKITPQRIDKAIEKDQFVFRADALSRIELIMDSHATAGPFEAYAELFDPAGGRVHYFRFDNGNQTIDLPDLSGNYMLYVYDDNYNATGTYEIGYESLKPISPNPRILDRNVTTPGTIANRMEKDQLLFRGVHNETVTIELTSIDEDAGFLAYAELYAPSGALMHQWRVDNGPQEITLDRGTANYMLQVRASDYRSRGSYTVTINGDPIASPINTPTGLVAANVWHDKVDLNWNDRSGNELGFQVTVSFDDGESWVTVGKTGANDRSFRVLNLYPGQSYKMKVRAFNDATVSDYSNVIDVITRLAPSTNLRATNLTATSLRLNWDDNSGNESGFQVYRRIGTGAWARIATTARNIEYYNVTGLTAGTRYEFKVRAVNPRSTSIFSNVLSLTTPSSAQIAASQFAGLSADDGNEN